MPARKEAAHPFIARVSDRTLLKNLESLRQKALDLGASGAEIIQAGQVVVDERVRLKCLIPRCLRAGETPNCPPNAPDLDLVRKAFARYTHAILLKTNVEPIKDYSPKSGKDSSGVDKTLLFHQKSAKIVSEIERLGLQTGLLPGHGAGRRFMQGLPVPGAGLPVQGQRQVPLPAALPAGHGSAGHRCLRPDQQGGLGHVSAVRRAGENPLRHIRRAGFHTLRRAI